MTEDRRRQLLAGFLERAEIAQRNNLPATAKSWRDLHHNLTQGEHEMDSRTMHPGKYLKASDFERPQLWTISGLREEEIQNQQTGKAEHKWIIYFVEDERGLVLNITNRLVIEEFLGFETDDWSGNQIVLYKGRAQFGSKTVDAIRLRPPRLPTAPATKTQPNVKLNVSQHQNELNPPDDEEIPF